MKNSLTISCLFFTLFSVMVLASCNKDADGNVVITVNGKAAESMTLLAAGETKTLVIKSTIAWQSEAIDWLTIDPATGAANQETTVSVTGTANTTGEERSGGVAFSVTEGNEFVELVVTQPAQ